MSPTLKQEIFDLCRAELQKRISAAEYAMKQAQESANTAEKSSMGDKYETDRAMSQNQRDMNAAQLANARQQLAMLNKIDIGLKHDSAQFGACIETPAAVYFLSVGLGVVKKGQKDLIALSMESPLASALKGKRKDDSLTFNGRKLNLEDIW